MSWSSSLRLWCVSGKAPKVAISSAPNDTNTVPMSEYRVNGSANIMLAHMELKTNPTACRGDKMTSGSVLIWTLDPRILLRRNNNRPSLHRPRLWAGLRWMPGGRLSSIICDLRCNVSPTACVADDTIPTRHPSSIVLRDSISACAFISDEAGNSQQVPVVSICWLVSDALKRRGRSPMGPAACMAKI